MTKDYKEMTPESHPQYQKFFKYTDLQAAWTIATGAQMDDKYNLTLDEYFKDVGDDEKALEVLAFVKAQREAAVREYQQVGKPDKFINDVKLCAEWCLWGHLAGGYRPRTVQEAAKRILGELK